LSTRFKSLTLNPRCPGDSARLSGRTFRRNSVRDPPRHPSVRPRSRPHQLCGALGGNSNPNGLILSRRLEDHAGASHPTRSNPVAASWQHLGPSAFGHCRRQGPDVPVLCALGGTRTPNLLIRSSRRSRPPVWFPVRWCRSGRCCCPQTSGRLRAHLSAWLQPWLQSRAGSEVWRSPLARPRVGCRRRTTGACSTR